MPEKLITNEKDIERIAGIDNTILRAYGELNLFSWTGIELNTYEKEEKRQRDERAVWSARLEDAEIKKWRGEWRKEWGKE